MMREEVRMRWKIVLLLFACTVHVCKSSPIAVQYESPSGDGEETFEARYCSFGNAVEKGDELRGEIYIIPENEVCKDDYSEDLNGKIVLLNIRRLETNHCTTMKRILKAQDAGAVATVCFHPKEFNSQSLMDSVDVVALDGINSNIKIPSVGISNDSANAIAALKEMPSSEIQNLQVVLYPPDARDNELKRSFVASFYFLIIFDIVCYSVIFLWTGIFLGLMLSRSKIMLYFGRKVILFEIWVISVFRILYYAIDPQQYKGLMGEIATSLLQTIPGCLMVMVFALLLFLWFIALSELKRKKWLSRKPVRVSFVVFNVLLFIGQLGMIFSNNPSATSIYNAVLGGVIVIGIIGYLVVGISILARQ
eukprot:TRINITY_DN9390_c0_g1_i1.p1 TRINITY_DN9390_c0_g1~~TRINITY_DN9390_c0_g1_i1.p1  ORF type:complete len:364 (-),score=52.65 TRINITY_DN9390_c0_g1_i1:90-1181(-)